MALTTESVAELQQYIKRVAERADHHALNVNEVIYPLIGLIVHHLDQESDIQVREYNGDPGNMLWVHINNTRYAFRYDHGNGGSIEIRKNSFNGPILHTVDNNTTIADLIKIFKSFHD
jgi:hypothetical protein